MKVYFTKNGVTKMYLQPEDDIDRAYLADLGKTPVEFYSAINCQIGDQLLADSYIVAPQSKKPIEAV